MLGNETPTCSRQCHQEARQLCFRASSVDSFNQQSTGPSSFQCLEGITSSISTQWSFRFPMLASCDMRIQLTCARQVPSLSCLQLKYRGNAGVHYKVSTAVIWARLAGGGPLSTAEPHGSSLKQPPQRDSRKPQVPRLGLRGLYLVGNHRAEINIMKIILSCHISWTSEHCWNLPLLHLYATSLGSVRPKSVTGVCVKELPEKPRTRPSSCQRLLHKDCNPLTVQINWVTMEGVHVKVWASRKAVVWCERASCWLLTGELEWAVGSDWGRLDCPPIFSWYYVEWWAPCWGYPQLRRGRNRLSTEMGLTRKRLDHFLISNLCYCKMKLFLYINIELTLWILMAWCFKYQGISSYSAGYTPKCFQLSMG